MKRALAIDLGASTGRAVLGTLDAGRLSLRELHRFDNTPKTVSGALRWDLDALLREIKPALRTLAKEGGADAIGVDTWGVDYVLIDNVGQRVGLPVSYRDSRTTGIMAQAMAQLAAAALDSRRHAALGATIAQRALLAIAANARRRG